MHIIAHRGSHENLPENSFASFWEAIELGCDKIELDLQWTYDEEIVIMHDDCLNRTAGIKACISELRYSQLKEIKLFNGSTIPRFSDVVSEILPNIGLNCEIKGDRPGLAEKAAQIVLRSPFQDKVLFSCFYDQPLLRLKENKIPIKRAILWGFDTLYIHPLYYFQPSLFLNNCGTKIIHPQADLIDTLKSYLDLSQYHITPWIPLNGENKDRLTNFWENICEYDITGLCTNKPKKFKTWLSKQKANQK